MEEYINKRTEEDELDYLAEIYVSVYLENEKSRSSVKLNSDVNKKQEPNSHLTQNSDTKP